jgi:hypothetical protein
MSDVKSPGYKAALDALREYQGKSDWGYTYSIFTQPFERDRLLSGEVDAREVLRIVRAGEKADGKKATVGTIHMAFGMVFRKNLPPDYLEASKELLEENRRDLVATEARFAGKKKLLKREQETIGFARDRVARVEHQVAEAEKLLERWKDEPLPNPAPAGLYSQLERVVQEKFPNKVSVQQAQGILRSSPVKKDELEWTGFEKWLDKQAGSVVTKAEALDYIKSNQVQIQEYLKGKGLPDPDLTVLRRRRDETRKARDDFYNAHLSGSFPEPELRDEWDRLVDAARKAEDELQRVYYVTRYEAEPKYQKYTVPGGRNYRELLLTLPPELMVDKSELARLKIQTTNDHGIVRYFVSRDGNLNALPQTYGTRAQAESAIQHRVAIPYRHGHWRESNVLAHVRFTDRTGVDGTKTLYLEEIQSDLHEEGRKQGYREQELTIPEQVVTQDNIYGPGTMWTIGNKLTSLGTNSTAMIIKWEPRVRQVSEEGSSSTTLTML